MTLVLPVPAPAKIIRALPYAKRLLFVMDLNFSVTLASISVKDFRKFY
jgi:hypothetical protein